MSVQALCDRLVANDDALTELEIDLDVVDDAELKLILEAAKKNKTLKKVFVTDSGEGRPLSIHVTLSLASLVSEHPEIQEIKFWHVSFIEFGPIALAIQQNRNVTRLRLGRAYSKYRRMHSLASHRECTRVFDPTKQQF